MTNVRVFKDEVKNSLNNLDNTSETKSDEPYKHYSIDDQIILCAKYLADKAGVKFPDEFDEWTQEEKLNWLRDKKFSQILFDVPETLHHFVNGIFTPLNNDRSQEELPEWFDMDKYRRGQKFVQDHYFSVALSALLALFYAISFNDFMRGFIIGGKLHTPHLAIRRYAVSILRITNWYLGDPWVKGTQAYKDMLYARKSHVIVREKLSQMTNDQIDALTTYSNPWCPNRELFMEDFATSCPFEKAGQRPYNKLAKLPYKPKGLNNADVAITQGCLVYTMLFRSRDIGIHNATDEDLEAFCHMWKCYGYFLGLSDENNVCRGSLEEIKHRVHDIMEYWVKCNYRDISPEWEHIMQCMIEPFNYVPYMILPYKPIVLLATDIIDLKLSRFYASFSYTEWAWHKIIRFVMEYALRFSIIRTLTNKWIYGIFTKIVSYNPKEQEELSKKLKTRLPEFSFAI